MISLFRADSIVASSIMGDLGESSEHWDKYKENKRKEDPFGNFFISFPSTMKITMNYETLKDADMI